MKAIILLIAWQKLFSFFHMTIKLFTALVTKVAVTVVTYYYAIPITDIQIGPICAKKPSV